MEEIKTKRFAEVLKNLKVKKALVVINDNDQKVVKSASNIPGVKVALCYTTEDGVTSTLNVYDILKYDTVVVTKSAVATIEEVYA